jgi:N-acetylmuramoyl-L-alanine amidase
MRRIAISSGHGTRCPGASGIIDEVQEATRVVDRVADLLLERGALAGKFHDTVSTTSADNLDRIVDWHNAQTRDLDVAVHFNAADPTAQPRGSECLYLTQDDLSCEVAAAIASASGLVDRGAKLRTDLYFLNNTEMPAILVEICFVDSESDVACYRRKFSELCAALAETISGEAIRPIPPAPGPDEVPTVSITTTGNVRLIINGVPLDDDGDEDNPWHDDITATVFGTPGDEQETCYGGWVDGDSHGVALPYKWTGHRPRVIVRGPIADETADIIDLGPWNKDDQLYVFSIDRPLAEQQYANQTEAQNGQVPANDAGIDLAPQTAEAIGIKGKGKVSWRFV